MKQRTNEAVWNANEGRWYIQIMKNGVRKRFYSSVKGRAGKIECEKKADEWLATGLKDGKVKVEVLFDKYIQDLKDNDLYYIQYEGFGRSRIKPSIGKISIEDLCEQDLQNILTKGYKDGLAKKTLQSIRGCMTSFLRFCRANRYTTLRPELLRVNKKAKVGTRRTLQPNELRTLFSSEDTEWYGKPVKDWYVYAYRFAVATGLRPGEVCALEWRNVAENGILTVEASYNSQLEMTNGKNENAHRTIAMNAEAKHAITDQKEMLKSVGIISKYVFPRQDTGMITSQRKLRKAWDHYCNVNGISHTTLYEMRHTYVSINKEMPIELLKAQMGHSTDMDTRLVYSHELQGEREKAAEYSTFAFEKIIHPSTQ